MEPIFTPLPDKPDHTALELEILEAWEREGTFEQLRAGNRGGPRFSFIDGPITANNPMGVHHAWGRTLKDVFQRYKALRGFDQRYQNGFDCQGLWVEVEVEKSLGLNSKREIEEYGLAEFAARCRERVARFSEEITERSQRLGMWMDWDRDYYTFSDTNIEYIWRFLAEVHRRGWLYQGHRSTVWCPRCGTSISQHEVFSGEYRELEHPSLFVRLPLKGREGESLVVWTTTPWTLPANVAAAVNPTADYGLTEDGEWWAVARKPDVTFVRTALGGELVGLEYEGPFDHIPAQEGVVAPRDPVGRRLARRRNGDRAHRARRGLRGLRARPPPRPAVLAPLDEAGRMLPGFGFDGLSTDDVAQPVIEDLERRGLLVESGTIVHRYPTCWRCGTPLVFRVVDDWFIAADEVRQPMLDANATVEWTPDFYSKRMDDWLRNMGDWNISRKRYYGLPLPFYPCACGHLNVIGSRAELEERAVRGLDQLQELHRPWIDGVVIRCESCSEEVHRDPGGRRRVARRRDRAALHARVGERRQRLRGLRNRRSEGSHARRPPGSRLLGGVVPRRLGLGDARADPPLVLLDLLHVRDARRPLAVPARAHLREAPRRDRPRDAPLVGERDRRGGGARAHGRRRHALAVLLAAAEPEPPVRLRPGPRDPAEAPHALELVQVPRRLRERRRLDARVGRSRRRTPSGELEPLDRWLVERTHALVAEATAAYESWLTVDVVRAYESFVDDLSNWYIRRSRRRFWDSDPVALGTLWYALVQGLRDRGAAHAVPHGSPVACADSSLRRRAFVSPPGRLARHAGCRTRSCSRRSRSFAASSSSDARRAPRRV